MEKERREKEEKPREKEKPVAPPTTKKSKKEAAVGKTGNESEPKGADKRAENILQQALKTFQLLEELTCDSIWCSRVRSSELERRLSKAGTSQGDLQKVQANDKADRDQKQRAADMEDKLGAVAKVTQSFKEICVILRGENSVVVKAISDGPELPALIKDCAAKLLSEPPVFMDMAHVVSKKVAEAQWFERQLFNQPSEH